MKLVKIKIHPKGEGFLVELLIDKILSAALYCYKFKIIEYAKEITCHNIKGIYLGSVFYDEIQNDVEIK